MSTAITMKLPANPKLQSGRVLLRSARGFWLIWMLIGLLLSAGVIVATALWLLEGVWPPSMFNQRQGVASALVKEEHRTPRLTFHTAQATINQPLPLGIALNDSAGNETLVLSGLAEGTSLSAGTALSTTRWALPGHDLDKAFISAPENFDGTMQIQITLYSSSQDIIETKQVRFEWSGSSKGDKLPVTISPTQRLSR